MKRRKRVSSCHEITNNSSSVKYLKGLSFQGILPPLLAETPKRATKFFTFEVYKDLFNKPSIDPSLVSFFFI